jgi:hypothetical protein
VGVGVAVRAFHVLRHDFPLNDGGLFHAMAADLRANGFVPPAHTSCGAGDIPFAYPPLGLYLAAVLDFVTPLSLVGYARTVTAWLLPPLYSIPPP